MPVIGLNEVMVFRLQPELSAEIDQIVVAKMGRYHNRSHFIRCAVQKLLREERGQKS